MNEEYGVKIVFRNGIIEFLRMESRVIAQSILQFALNTSSEFIIVRGEPERELLIHLKEVVYMEVEKTTL